MIQRTFAAALVTCMAAGSLTAQFGPSAPYPGSAPSHIDAGDLDGDGNVDLLTSSSTPNCLAYLNDGGGGYGVPVPLPQPGATGDVKTADFDSSFGLDYVAIVSATEIAVHLSNGPFPAYATEDIYTVTATALQVEVADMDRDGDVDIVVLTQNVTGEISIFANNGDGTFAAPVIEPLSATPTAFTVGNMNSRRGPGLLYTTMLGTIGMLVTSTVPLTFEPEVFIPTAPRPTGITTGDFNGDGHQDIAVSNGGFGTAATVHISEGSCSSGWQPFVSFLPLVTYAVPGTDNAMFAITDEDFDCDGDLDLVLANWNSEQVAVLFNSGTGAFGGSVVHSTDGPCTDLVAARLNGLHPDVATANDTDISVLLNNTIQGFCDHVFIGGIRDDFATTTPSTVEDVCPGSELDAFLSAYPRADFDATSCNRTFGHTFGGLPDNMLSATLEIRLRAVCGGSWNDDFKIGLNDACNTYSSNHLIANLADLPWTSGDTATLVFDLEDLPGHVDLMRKMQQDGRLDISIQDDTAIDYMVLRITTCGPLRQDLELDHTPYLAGTTTTYTCYDVTPGASVFFFLDLSVGPGPLFPPWGGFCLPAPLPLGPGTPSGDDSVLDLAIPPLPACSTFASQAVEVVFPTPVLTWSNTMTQQAFL